MSKRIRENDPISIAVEILGQYQDGKPVAVDQRTGETLDPRNIDHKIRIYEREVKEWFLNIASRLITDESYGFDNGFVVLMICMAYFEGVEQYKTGKSSSSNSKKCFKDSVARLYPGKFHDKELGELYSKSRCGLFHNGMVKGEVVFSYHFNEPIEFWSDGDIRINSRRLLEDIRNDFDRYLDELKDVENKVDRDNFGRMFKVLDS